MFLRATSVTGVGNYLNVIMPFLVYLEILGIIGIY